MTEHDALRALVKKLEALLADPQFKSVFTIAYIHGSRYAGPTIDRELADAKAALAKRGD